jgi:hypothetical protein
MQRPSLMPNAVRMPRRPLNRVQEPLSVIRPNGRGSAAGPGTDQRCFSSVYVSVCPSATCVSLPFVSDCFPGVTGPKVSICVSVKRPRGRLRRASRAILTA